MVTRPEGRMETRRGRGKISRQNARADRRNKSSSASPFEIRSEERQGEGGVSVRLAVRMQRAQKESGAQCCEVVCGELEKPARERIA